jgi:N-carbamoylputrescine amidase
VAQGDSVSESVVMVDMDDGLMEETRRNWPFLRDRRVESYQGLLSRFGA